MSTLLLILAQHCTLSSSPVGTIDRGSIPRGEDKEHVRHHVLLADYVKIPGQFEIEDEQGKFA